MNSRTWRAGALGLGMAVIVLLATQRAAGEPTRPETVSAPPPISQTITAQTAALTGLVPESGSLVLLGAAFVVVAQQLRRLV